MKHKELLGYCKEYQTTTLNKLSKQYHVNKRYGKQVNKILKRIHHEVQLILNKKRDGN